jgi:hypothetical protein
MHLKMTGSPIATIQRFLIRNALLSQTLPVESTPPRPPSCHSCSQCLRRNNGDTPGTIGALPNRKFIIVAERYRFRGYLSKKPRKKKRPRCDPSVQPDKAMSPTPCYHNSASGWIRVGNPLRPYISHCLCPVSPPDILFPLHIPSSHAQGFLHASPPLHLIPKHEPSSSVPQSPFHHQPDHQPDQARKTKAVRRA